jgi:peptide chain release factor subunit 1
LLDPPEDCLRHACKLYEVIMQLDGLIDRLAAIQPSAFPVISLYLDGRPDQHGHERYGVFARKELATRARAWTERSPQRDSFHRDVERILGWLTNEARPSANGLAIFACAGEGDFFEAVQLDVPIEQDQLLVGATPRILPLVRLAAQYRRYAAVVLDSQSARIFVFGLGEVEAAEEIEGEKIRRADAGGWSQARFQRHMDNFAIQHVKEVLDALDDIVRAEGIDRIVLAGDEAVVPLVRDQLPKPLEDRLVAFIRLEMTAGDREVLEHTLAAVREADARQDTELVTRVLAAQRSGGLGAAGLEDVQAALGNGQVHELLLAADPEAIPTADGVTGPEIAEALVYLARQTSARVIFVEDASLLEPVGGVAARLRYKIGGMAA